MAAPAAARQSAPEVARQSVRVLALELPDLLQFSRQGVSGGKSGTLSGIDS